eukprot:TRINITY_DN10965_c0_g3_i1.p1 TRINITY_DN10965_c0_g3~~TRINITY_DN10965_c0_g3_i1.p1  ORF type:complete len:240 (-),score=44.70 TRINITY_DN10965_c0_g3_i1:56-775(-)
MWNITSGICFAIFGGDQGHRGQVLHIDVHMSETKFVSCGADNSIRIWSLEGLSFLKEQSYHFLAPKERKMMEALAKPFEKPLTTRFKTKTINFPLFVSEKIHQNYIDCVAWHGDLILSKCTRGNLILWCPSSTLVPGYPMQNSFVILMKTVLRPSNKLWFMHFDMNQSQTRIAQGTKNGQIHVYTINDKKIELQSVFQSGYRQPIPIRHLAFSYDSKFLLAANDRATIFCLKEKQQEQN